MPRHRGPAGGYHNRPRHSVSTVVSATPPPAPGKADSAGPRGMRKYLLQRVLQLLLVLVVASAADWYLIYLVPGSPVNALLGSNATPAQVTALDKSLGLNRSLVSQYITWLGHVLHGNLGSSYVSGLSTSTLLGQRLPASLQLVIASFTVGLLLALVLGILAATRPRTILSSIVSGYTTLSLSVPTFWLGILLILLFSVRLHFLPGSGTYIPVWQHPIAGLRAMALPVATLGLYVGGIMTRFVRSAVANVLEADYVRTARSVGVPERLVILKHALRNALLPIVTVTGLQFGAFIGGTVITEAVFQYPGIGTLVLSSVQARDYAVLQGTVLLLVAAVAVVNLGVDLTYAYLNPRIRYG
ncbi:MAG: ABC transporter permease [Acidimicrobiales bacterium]